MTCGHASVPSGSRMLRKGTQNITTKRQLARPIDGNGRKQPGWDARHNARQSEVESPRHYVRLAENSFVQARKLVIADLACPATGLVPSFCGREQATAALGEASRLLGIPPMRSHRSQF